MKTLLSLVMAATLWIGAAPAQAQTSQAPVPVTSLMAPRDLDATGVNTLSPAQLAALSAWLDNYKRAAEWLAVTAAQGEDAMPAEEQAVETFIDGDFDGWEGNTVFRLQNGQVWQQASPSARYLFAHAPKVTISRAPHRVQVEGMRVEIAVRRLR
jgi:hypothetical protein